MMIGNKGGVKGPDQKANYASKNGRHSPLWKDFQWEDQYLFQMLS